MTDSLKVSTTHELTIGSSTQNPISFQITATKALTLGASIEIPCGPAKPDTKYLCRDEKTAKLTFASEPPGRITGNPQEPPEDGKLTWIADEFSLDNETVSIVITGFNPERDGENASLYLKIWDDPEAKPLLYDAPSIVTIKPALKVAVLSFKASPPSVLQRNEVTISSQTVKAQTVKLLANGVYLPDVPGSKTGDYYLDKTWSHFPDLNPTKYQLNVDGQFPVPDLIVGVELRGGLQARDLLGNSLKPAVAKQRHYPTLLLKAKDLSANTTEAPSGTEKKEEFPKLYGVFTFVDGDTKRSELWSSGLGVDDWSMESKKDFPTYMGESPGVIHNNALWLVGGSSADPEGPYSNRVCAYYKQDEQGAKMIWKEWEVDQKNPFPPRMGHACAVFDDKIWVLGGVSPDGAPLDDIWSCEIPEKLDDFHPRWEECATPLPSPRCMCSVAVTPKGGGEPARLWLYGGTTHPDNVDDTFDDLWWTKKIEDRWEHLKLPGEEEKTLNATERATLGATLLYGSDGHLHLVRQFRGGQTAGSDQKLIGMKVDKPWEAAKKREFPWQTPVNNLFLMRSVSFRERWIFWPVDQYMDKLTYNSQDYKTNYSTMVFNADKFN